MPNLSRAECVERLLVIEGDGTARGQCLGTDGTLFKRKLVPHICGIGWCVPVAEASARQYVLRLKSLLGYAHALGYTPFNAGATIKVRSNAGNRGATLHGKQRIIRPVALRRVGGSPLPRANGRWTVRGLSHPAHAGFVEACRPSILWGLLSQSIPLTRATLKAGWGR